MTVFKNISRALLNACLVGHLVIHVVGLIEVIPADLGNVALAGPQVSIELLGSLISEIGRQVTVIIGTRVSSPVPVERSLAVERLVISKTRVERGVVVGLPHPVQDGRGVKRLDHLGIALLAFLPAPVRTVHVAAYQLSTLLIDGRVGGTLGGSAKSG